MKKQRKVSESLRHVQAAYLILEEADFLIQDAREKLLRCKRSNETFKTALQNTFPRPAC